MLKVYFPWKYIDGKTRLIREGFGGYKWGINSKGDRWFSQGKYTTRKKATMYVDKYLRMWGYYLC